jgi:hypothetical protein
VRLVLYLVWLVHWTVRINILQQELTLDDKHYLIRKYMGWSETAWKVGERARQ